jgi:hypothetical protein
VPALGSTHLGRERCHAVVDGRLNVAGFKHGLAHTGFELSIASLRDDQILQKLFEVVRDNRPVLATRCLRQLVLLRINVLLRDRVTVNPSAVVSDRIADTSRICDPAVGTARRQDVLLLLPTLAVSRVR